MPDLNKKYFSSEKDISAEKGRELVTKGDSEDIIRTLTKLGWEGQLIAAVIIRVSVDGRRAEDGQFSLRGALANEPIRIQAAKLWEKADEDVTLEIDVPPGDRFDFQGGRLYSDYLDQDKVKYKLTKEGRILTEAEKKKHGLGDFCLRALTHLSRSSNGAGGPAMKFTVLAHHMGAYSLTELSEATQGPSWPGIKILEGQCQLFPAAPVGTWGAPFLPLLDVQSRASSCESIPVGDQLRFAIAGIMRTAARPTGCVSIGGLLKYTSKMQWNVDEVEPNKPTITWPVAATPGEEIVKSVNLHDNM